MWFLRLILPVILLVHSGNSQSSSVSAGSSSTTESFGNYFTVASTTSKPPSTTTQAPPPSYVYRSYQTTVYCSASSPIQYPSTVTEVQDIVMGAIVEGRKVKAIGSRHSLTDTICTDGVPMAMQNINYTIINSDDTATVGAGAEMLDVLESLEANGRSLIHVPAFGGITVAGAMGTGAHGSSLLHPPSLSDQVVRVTIVDGLGNIQVIDGGEDLKAFRVHLGLLGVLVDVTLRTVPLFKMVVQNTIESENILFNGTALQSAREYDWYQIWWFPSTKQVVVSKGNYTSDLSIPGNATTNLIPDLTPSDIGSARETFESLQGTRNKRGLYAIQDFTQRSLVQNVVGKPPIFTEDGRNVVNPATGYAYRLQANKCTNKCVWANGNNSINPEESAMAFDMQELPGIVATIKGILSEVPAVFAMVGVFIRFSMASDATMAIENGRESVHVEWATPMRNDQYNASRDGTGAYQAILQAMLKQHNGRPHWGKNGLYYLSTEVIRAKMPNIRAFVQMMKKYDPNGIFMNKFGRRLTGESTEFSMDPEVRRCALQDYCLCKVNADCTNLQTCDILNGYSICRDPLPSYIPQQNQMKGVRYDPNNFTSIVEAFKPPSEETSKPPPDSYNLYY